MWLNFTILIKQLNDFLTSKASTSRCSIKKSVLKNFKKFMGKHLCQSLFFNKFAGLRTANLLKKRLWLRYFPVNFAKFIRTPFYRTPLDDCFYHLFYKWVSLSQVRMRENAVQNNSEYDDGTTVRSL